MCVQDHMKLLFFFGIKSLSISLNVWDWWWSQSQSQFLRPKTKVSVSVSIFETIFIKSQSQNLIPILKVSVSVSKIETGYTESQSQSQHAKTGLAHPWNLNSSTRLIMRVLMASYSLFVFLSPVLYRVVGLGNLFFHIGTRCFSVDGSGGCLLGGRLSWCH